jgi:hypothetical protein
VGKVLNLLEDFEDQSFDGCRSEWLFKGKYVLVKVIGSGFEVGKGGVGVGGFG